MHIGRCALPGELLLHKQALARSAGSLWAGQSLGRVLTLRGSERAERQELKKGQGSHV
uniref:Uncharacterized protein n=1 Tax=mine drainage metagenome TaxID=410659 RepID=E6Q371_9ZZZZ